ncbi:ABC transporter permease [Angustibacter sp. Root456]|uniref:ABC transporter permease n=1 Tax=Angustibacter sp. Root456 TaxID=1736539 RepID=UPI0006F42EC2|nr:ABC transporter permease [Angustibacter sp. Root456]KQX66613.1 ABC transporter [Angustibacter sp. Root456]
MSAPSATGPAPAPAPQRVLAQARFETSVLLRNGEQLLVAIVLPALALVGLTLAHVPDLGGGRRIDVVSPGVLALAVMSTAFTGQAIQTGFDRRYGVLRLLGTTPLGRGGLLVGKALAVLVVEAIQVVVLGGLGLALGWHPHWAGVPVALLIGVLGTWAFVALALLLAGTVRAEAVLAVANLVWVLLLAAGAVVVPARTLPAGLEAVASWLPSGALGEGLRAALTHGGVDLRALLALTLWGAVGTVAARRLFRWS